MSVPKNHHYVSQCHLKEFFNKNEGKIYVYDKQLNNFYPKETTKSLFSGEYLNSKVIDGEVNHINLEIQLNVLIEDDFSKHLKIVKKFLNDHDDIENAYWSLNNLVLIGIVGELRHPLYKSAIDQTMEQIESDLTKRIRSATQTDIKIGGEKKKLTKYENQPDYLDVAIKIFSRMDPITFSIYHITSSDHFLIPDTSCFQIRAMGDIGEILQIGIPVSDKIFILGSSKNSVKKLTQIVTLGDDDSAEVFRINTDLATFAYKGIACSDMAFLKRTINKIKGVGNENL